MFTSRAEYRLLLRADNADQRLTQKGIAIGCVATERARMHTEKSLALKDAREFSNSVSLTPKEAERHGISLNKDGQRRTAFEMLSYPNIASRISRKSGRALPRSTGRSPSRSRSMPSTTSISRQAADVAAYGVMRVSHCRTISITPRCPDFSNETETEVADASPAHDRTGQPHRRHDAGGAHIAGCSHPARQKTGREKRVSERGQGAARSRGR